MRRKGMHRGFCWESQKERDHWEQLKAGGRVILTYILERWDVVVPTGFIWLRIETSGVLLRTR
jgi:hypothetical protein